MDSESQIGLPRSAHIETERLILRRWTDADREPFAVLNADPQVMEFFFRRLSRDESDAFVDRIEGQFDRAGWGLYAVDVTDTNDTDTNDGVGGFIGFVGLSVVPSELGCAPAIEIGWRLARHSWGHGYATEAASAVVDRARDIGLGDLVSITSKINVRSRKVMERIGMVRDVEGDYDSPFIPAGHPLRPHVLYRLHLGPGGPSPLSG